MANRDNRKDPKCAFIIPSNVDENVVTVSLHKCMNGDIKILLEHKETGERLQQKFRMECIYATNEVWFLATVLPC